MNRLLLVSLLLHASAFASPHIASYRAEIRSSASNIFTVDIAVKTDSDLWQKPAQIIEREGAKISDVRLVSRGGSLPSHVESVGLVDRLIAEQAAQEYSIHYRVEANPSGHTRIPLAVPEIATTGAPAAVTISVFSDSADLTAGDTFPSFYRKESGAFAAELANVPGHVELTGRGANESGFLQKLLTPSRLSDLAVIALLVIGSITRATMRRKGQA